MKPSPYTDRYSPQQIEDYYGAGPVDVRDIP